MANQVTCELNCLEIRYMLRFALINYNLIHKAISYFEFDIMQMNCLKALMAILANLINNLVTENHSNYISQQRTNI